MGEGDRTLEVIQHLIEALEALAERVDRMDARLRVVERPFCEHEWSPWSFNDQAVWCRTCRLCGLKEYGGV